MSRSTHNTDYQLLLSVLKTARKRMGVSQVELAERLRNTQTFVSKCERGERRIDAVELVEFAEALDIAPQDLLKEYLEKRGSRLFARSRKTMSGN
ncbi:helix-turn-helix domain-containing protein [Ottowia sp. VDI28]|uniref:helix-turn-helix domain-containing protein n=1 Tax=Ottowia sp. VDI28 TaxID=3133968 RepID=UPI003C2BB49F